ncbi:MAG: fucose isomerase [Ruminococcaceae bacterium]|nr:fucose isomerase [Oscillospiraceae bacterium]
MLKGISKIIPPELLKILMEMGHGDEIVIGDGNFPAASCAVNSRLVRCDGHGVPELLDAILALFPLDSYVEKPIALMNTTNGDPTPEIWAVYEEIAARHEPDHHQFELVERFEFYERAKKAYAIVSSGESAIYANIILKKGVIK